MGDGLGAEPYEFFAWLHYSLPDEASRNCKVIIVVIWLNICHISPLQPKKYALFKLRGTLLSVLDENKSYWIGHIQRRYTVHPQPSVLVVVGTWVHINFRVQLILKAGLYSGKYGR
jgi:hypothetical protein